MAGEPLRSKTHPSVTELVLKRFEGPKTAIHAAPIAATPPTPLRSVVSARADASGPAEPAARRPGVRPCRHRPRQPRNLGAVYRLHADHDPGVRSAGVCPRRDRAILPVVELGAVDCPAGEPDVGARAGRPLPGSASHADDRARL